MQGTEAGFLEMDFFMIKFVFLCVSQKLSLQGDGGSDFLGKGIRQSGCPVGPCGTLSALISLYCNEAWAHSVVSDSAIAWIAARQTPLSMGFFLGKNTAVGCHRLLQFIFNPGIKSMSPVAPALQADSLP